MVDIKEPRNSLIDYLIFRFAPLLALPIGAGMYWVASSVLGIRDIGWLVLAVGLPTAAITAAIVYGWSTLAEPRSPKKGC